MRGEVGFLRSLAQWAVRSGRRRCRCTRVGVLVLALVLSIASTFGQNPDETFEWHDAGGEKCPLRSYGEIEGFLSTARVTEVRNIGSTTANPLRLTLTDGRTVLHAVFRHVDILKRRVRTSEGLEVDFRDFALFECAAYRLSRLFLVGHVPPTVRRTFSPSDFEDSRDLARLPHREGSLQAWVEGAITEKERRAEDRHPPPSLAWLRQIQLMWLFDELIENRDRNQGNMLIDKDWTLWFIDATRSFRTDHDLKRPEAIRFCGRRTWERLRSVPDSTLERELDPFLTPAEMRALLARRRHLVEYIEGLIRKRGEEAVLF